MGRAAWVEKDPLAQVPQNPTVTISAKGSTPHGGRSFPAALPKDGIAYSRATRVAMPMPPPTHKVAKPMERSRRAIS